MFPKTWPNPYRRVERKSGGTDVVFTYRRGGVTLITLVQSGYYPTPAHLVQRMKSQLQQTLARENKRLLEAGTISFPSKMWMDIRFNNETQLVELYFENKKGMPLIEDEATGEMVADFEFILNAGVARLLGFSGRKSFKTTGLHTAEHSSPLGELSPIYIYCDLIEPRIVGHVMAPLLGVVSHQDTTSKEVTKRYEKLQYHPVIKKNFNNIHISLRDDQGDFIPFEQGKVIVTIHLRPTKVQHL